MEFSHIIRKNKYISFYKDINTLLKNTTIKNDSDSVPTCTREDLTYTRQDHSILSFFKNKKLLASGREGVIYVSCLVQDRSSLVQVRSSLVQVGTDTKSDKKYINDDQQINECEDNNVVIKVVDLQALIEQKGVHPKILNKNPLFIYNLFYSLTRNVNMPSLIENIIFILTNQVVFQNICPHFILNYYWEYSNNKLVYYNEYANYSTLFHWGKTNHSYQEWMNILCQIIISIITMQRYFNIIHGDLHSLNILIYKVKKGGYWKYIIDNNEYIIPNLGFVILLSDFGFATIPGKVYVKWYFDNTLKHLTKKEIIFFDFKYLSDDLIKQNQPIKNLLKESFQQMQMTNKKYTLIDLLNNYYTKLNPDKSNDTFIEIYNLNIPLNTNLLPLNFKHLSTF